MMIRVNRIYRPSGGPAWQMLPTTAVYLNPEHIAVVERGEMYDHDGNGEGFTRVVAKITMVSGRQIETIETAAQIVEMLG